MKIYFHGRYNMKNCRLLHGLIVIMFSIVVARTVVSAQNTFRIGITDFPPYTYKLQDGTMTGLATKIVQEVLRGMQVETFVIEEYPWARALKMLTNGKLHGLYTIGKTDERAELYYYPDEPLLMTKWIFFIRQENVGKLTFTRLEDLKGHLIGVMRAYKYTPEFWDFVKKEQNYIESAYEEIMFKNLANDRLEYVLCDYAVGIAMIKRLGLENVIVPLAEHPLDESPVYIAFSKKVVALDFVVRFSQELKVLKMRPIYQTIQQEYIGK
ncbi:MAG: hypothetical protein C0403_06875 [Desulfobacterium sp.]|nr:hypothetical protein [Desulfobacterium sp.]